MLHGAHLVCPSPPCPMPLLSISASKVTLGLEADGGIFPESIYSLRYLLRPADSEIRPNSSFGRQCWIGLYLRIGEPGWASNSLKVSHIPQGLFDTLLSSLRLLWSLLCNHVFMRPTLVHCTLALTWRLSNNVCQTVPSKLGISGILLAHVPIQFVKLETQEALLVGLILHYPTFACFCLVFLPTAAIGATMSYKVLRDIFCLGSVCSKRP